MSKTKDSVIDELNVSGTSTTSVEDEFLKLTQESFKPNRSQRRKHLKKKCKRLNSRVGMKDWLPRQFFSRLIQLSANGK